MFSFREPHRNLGENQSTIRGMPITDFPKTFFPVLPTVWALGQFMNP